MSTTVLAADGSSVEIAELIEHEIEMFEVAVTVTDGLTGEESFLPLTGDQARKIAQALNESAAEVGFAEAEYASLTSEDEEDSWKTRLRIVK